MSHKVSHNQFFLNLGAVDRMTLAASLPLHKAYVAATPEQRADLFKRAVLNYVMGKLKLDRVAVEKILEQTRSQRSVEHERAVNAAGNKARNHLVRDFKPQQAKTEPVVVKVSASKVKAVIAIAAGMTKAEFDLLLSTVRNSVEFK